MEPDKLPAWRTVEIDRIDISPAHGMAYKLIPATCSKVGAAMNELRREIEKEYKIKPEDSVALDLAIHRAIAQIKSNATEPLRRALIHACSKIPAKKKRKPTPKPKTK